MTQEKDGKLKKLLINIYIYQTYTFFVLFCCISPLACDVGKWFLIYYAMHLNFLKPAQART